MGSLGALVNTDNHQTLARKLILSTILGGAPKVGKGLLCILVLFNIRSWPWFRHFALAIRFVLPVLLQHLWQHILKLFTPRAVSLRMEDRWLDSITPVGAHPFIMLVPYKSRATLADIDFNGHLSNSSYAKILDGARGKAVVEMFPMFFRSSGWMALAATHYSFLREIPMFCSYEIRTSIACWDDKWLYMISKFVRKNTHKKPVKTQTISPVNGEISSEIRPLGNPDIDEISSNGTPFIAKMVDTKNALNGVAPGLTDSEDSDAAILHAVVISQLCYKIDRITVPPSLVLAVNGFTGESGFSRLHPHSQWTEAKKIMSKPMGGSPKKLKAFLAGDWKEVPESGRWWEQALGGAVEAQRVKNLSVIEGLKRGLGDS